MRVLSVRGQFPHVTRDAWRDTPSCALSRRDRATPPLQLTINNRGRQRNLSVGWLVDIGGRTREQTPSSFQVDSTQLYDAPTTGLLLSDSIYYHMGSECSTRRQYTIEPSDRLKRECDSR